MPALHLDGHMYDLLLSEYRSSTPENFATALETAIEVYRTSIRDILMNRIGIFDLPEHITSDTDFDSMSDLLLDYCGSLRAKKFFESTGYQPIMFEHHVSEIFDKDVDDMEIIENSVSQFLDFN